MKKITSQNELYTELIRDLYSAEVQEIPALRAFKRLASSKKLSTFLQRCIMNTRMQILRLEDWIENHHESLIEEHCRTMKSMIAEARELAERCDKGPLRNTAIIGSLRRIKHCEVQTYRMLIEMADELGIASESEILEHNLQKEIGMLEQLSALSTQQPEMRSTQEEKR